MKRWFWPGVVIVGLAWYKQDDLLSLWYWLQDSFVVILLVLVFLFVFLGIIARARQAHLDKKMAEDYNKGLARKPSTQAPGPVAPQVVYQLPQGYGMNMPAQPPQASKATFIELPADRIELL